MDMVGKSIGSGIRVDYSNKEAKLEVYFQIPTLQQLLELKITNFNQDCASGSTKNIKGKKVTKETYKVFLKNILEEFSEKDDFDSNFEDMPHETLYISAYAGEDELFLEKHKYAKEVLYNSVIKVDPKYRISLDVFGYDSFCDWEHGFDLCPFHLILIVNGWSTDIIEKSKNIFIRWTFSFDKLTNKLVEDVFNTEIHNASIYEWIEPGTHYEENLIHLMYSPFDLDEYLLYYPHSITQIFEHQLDPKKIIRKEPLEHTPDRYENI